MLQRRQRAVVSVINDLVTDNRVLRTCGVLGDCGFDVLLIGRKLPGSRPLPAWPFAARRMRMIFRSGPLFYLFFNARLFFLLLTRKADLLFANDLDTLLPNFLVSRLRRIPLVYDSHELFCEVPELQAHPVKRWIWRTLEKFLVPKLKHCVTVNASIAGIFRDRYGVEFGVVRNIPAGEAVHEPRTRKELGLPDDRKIVILQGAGINVNRGAEELVEAMKLLDGVLLLVIGGGDVWAALERRTREPDLKDRVMMIGKMPAEELAHYTARADVGVSIDKPGNPNYENSLPNKIFDYIRAGIPVLASRLKEPEAVLEKTGTGIFIERHDPGHIAAVLRRALAADNLQALKERAGLARSLFSWQVEQKTLRSVIAAATAPAS